MSIEYGNAASARATPNSACTTGSATGTMYMPHAPMVMSSSVTTRRPAAYGVSVCRLGGAAACGSILLLTDENLRSSAARVTLRVAEQRTKHDTRYEPNSIAREP